MQLLCMHYARHQAGRKLRLVWWRHWRAVLWQLAAQPFNLQDMRLRAWKQHGSN